ncbi:MAG: GAF domain-containing protein [Anaerolineae bacterium]|nr:GAF domain-containing protein [Anaerolineae bacterium]
MNAKFFALLEKRSANLRLRGIALALVICSLLIARWFIYFQAEFIFAIAVLYIIELTVVWLLLRRLEKIPDQPHTTLLLQLTGQLQVLAELLLLTWAVYYTGGIISPLLPLYFIYIFADGLSSYTRALVFHGAVASLLLLVVALGTFAGWLNRYNIGLFPENDLWRNAGFVGGSLIVFGAMMIVTLVISITLSRRTCRREIELGESAGQLSVRVQQVSNMRDIGQRLASLLGLDQVLDAVGASALKIVNATDAHIYPYDEDTAQFLPGAGVWSDGHRGTVVNTPRPDGLSARVVKTKRPIIIDDAENDPLFQSLQAKTWGLASIASFPLIKAARIVGVLNVAFLEPHHFTPQEQEALLVLADQAAIALDNARLYTQVQRKIQELSALNAVSQSAAHLTDINSMLNDALGAILSAISADAVLAGILNERAQVLDLAAQRGLTGAALDDLVRQPLHPGEGFGGIVIQSGKPYFAEEISKDPQRFGENATAAFTSIYTVPLRAYDHMIGVLQLLWREQHHLTAAEVSLCGAIAPQLAAAIYNSTLFNETKRRADELTTLRAIGLATTSTLNLREQLRLLYENVNQLLRADTFFVGVYDETRNELRIEYIVEEGWFLRPQQMPLAQAGLSGWVIKNQKSLLVADVQNSETLPTQPVHLTRPARSWLGVPLMLKERAVGLISAQSFQPNAFTPQDERFLIAAAQHVALALDNARLFAESERRARELTLLNEISRAISASLDLDEVMQRAARALADQLGYRYVGIYELDGDQLVCKASIADVESNEPWDTSRGVIGRVARTGRAALITNVRADPDFVSVHEDVVSEICVPIVREGRVLGLVNVEETRIGALKQDDLALLSVLSEQLAIAASNASLYHEALGRERFATRLGQLGMTMTSTLDVVQLIEILCREALALFGSDTAVIYLRETVRDVVRPESRALASVSEISSGPERAHLVCRAAAGIGREELLGTAVEIDQLGNLLARTLRLGRGAIVHDAHSSTQLSPQLRAIVQPEAALAVPIMKEHDVIGVLMLCDRQDPIHFGEPELARAQIVASQAGLAISNARLLAEAQRRAKEQSSLYEIGLAISSTLDLGEQLRIIYDQVAKHFQLSGFDIALRGENNELEFALYIEQGKPLSTFSKPMAEAGFAGWVVSSRRTLVIDDIERQAETLPVKPGEHGTFNDTASYIGIPLMTKSEAMGVMALQRSPVEPFTADEQRFLFALAQQVAFAVDNARLHQQSQHRAAQQSLLYRASRRIAGALNLDTLLTGIVDALSKDFGYPGVLVMLVDREANVLQPAAVSADVRSIITQSYRQPVGVGLMGLAAQTGETQLSNDTRDDPRFLAVKNWRPMSEVAMAIRSGDQVIGVLNVESAEVHAFTDEDVRMFEAIADQLAVAIENATLFTRAQERLARLNALQNIQIAILSTMSLVDRLDLILEHAVTQMRAHMGVILMRDSQTRELYGLRQRGSRDLVSFRELRIKPGQGAGGWIMEHGEPLYIADVSQDERWSRTTASVNEGVVSYLGVPLRVEERSIGVIDVSTRTPRLFTDEEINFFTTLASHAAVAIENARLYEQTRAQLEKLRDTQDRLVESERRAAIGELVAGLAHEINNPLTAIVGHSQLLMETIPDSPSTDSWRSELDTIGVAAQRIARIVQEFIKLSQVEGGHTETINLADVIHHAVARFEAREDSQDIAISEILPTEPLWVRANAQLIEQVLGSLLTNALEAMPHGGAIDVTAGFAESGQIFCAVRDSGYGVPAGDVKRVFEPGYTTKVESGVMRGVGLGLYTAQRIVVSHGGTIDLDSREGKYTIVTFTLPRAKLGGGD